MKTLIAFLIGLSALSAQTVSIGGIVSTPDATAALNAWIVAHPASVKDVTTGAIGVADATILLPTSLVSSCVESYGAVTLTSAGNVSTLSSVATVNVPTGTRVTISNSLTAAYNTTFVTTSAPSSGAGLTFALTIADGNYANTSPSTNGYPVLTYNRCAVLIDSEAIQISGTTDGVNYAATRGALGTTAATHAIGATITPLQYADIRALDRANTQALHSTILQQQPTPAITAQLAIITAAQAQITKLQKASGQ